MTEQTPKTTLENGVRVLSQHMDGVRSVSVGVLVDVGPKDEQPSERGYSHLLEHMLFQGPMSHQIMVVDDEPAMLNLIGLLLEKSGFQVLKTTSAFQALEILNELTPDLFILDIMMPDIDGIELCRQIRARAQTRNTPVVMLSARHDTKTMDAAFAAGVNEYLSKPILPHDLRTALSAICHISWPSRIGTTCGKEPETAN